MASLAQSGYALVRFVKAQPYCPIGKEIRYVLDAAVRCLTISESRDSRDSKMVQVFLTLDLMLTLNSAKDAHAWHKVHRALLISLASECL